MYKVYFCDLNIEKIFISNIKMVLELDQKNDILIFSKLIECGAKFAHVYKNGEYLSSFHGQIYDNGKKISIRSNDYVEF